ncbi:MAG: UDP-N-acetylmuramoyl-L-alanyl-D-glutamate--2,6-diaminopimelate ligase [Candidatus Kapabacteria bacterium]|nr:UDP-N-acetylmuramoyl-L-alanyl-D-glutamate--2,6-diaminopimelate ligase [Candidatus Kapabacteria bacterium]MDW7997207.1 UDP-N-acetylmuramoyl-L-alanyl-D-glutamate--2,6-diaminopimelate ligase [Bacteroidota bacterium]MDW8224770.1 UDP-N-acetylmuramoyl-L-alanyl-D-glutamate--2,6-diaminopimelate ligase [Bacteroidota bacterium]
MRRSVFLGSLLQGLPCEWVQGGGDVPVTALCEDSRRCDAGALFVAVKGMSVDGHSFISDAIRRGVKAVVCENPPEPLPPECSIVRVPDTRVALAHIAHRFYGEPGTELRLVGVTGTNGKTTTTFFVRSVLEHAGIPTGILGTTGAYFGAQRRSLSHTTPTPIELAELLAWLRHQGAEAVAIEVSSHALEQRRVEALRFAAVLFTNLTHEHLDYHGTMENYARAKRRLFGLVLSDAVAVACEMGDGWGTWMLEAALCSGKYRVGTGPEMDIQLRLQGVTRGGTCWQMRLPDIEGWAQFQSQLVGEYNAYNAALAVTLGWAWGIGLESLQEAVATTMPPPGRMDPIQLPNGVLALVDYAHTPDALERALKAVRQLVPEYGRLVCVFGCGGERDRAKRPQMGAIAAQWSDAIVLTNDNPRHEPPEHILSDILAGIPAVAQSKVLCVPDREMALRTAVEMSRSGDVILVAGKGHEQHQILGDLRLPFSDREVLERIAQSMSVVECARSTSQS